MEQKRSGYVKVIREYFKGKGSPRNIRDISKDLPQFTPSQISSALNYLCRIGVLDRYITDKPHDGTPYVNIWHYTRSKHYYKKIKKNNELKDIPKKKPVKISVTGGEDELQKSEVIRDSEIVSMPDVRN